MGKKGKDKGRFKPTCGLGGEYKRYNDVGGKQKNYGSGNEGKVNESRCDRGEVGRLGAYARACSLLQPW